MMDGTISDDPQWVVHTALQKNNTLSHLTRGGSSEGDRGGASDPQFIDNLLEGAGIELSPHKPQISKSAPDLHQQPTEEYPMDDEISSAGHEKKNRGSSGGARRPGSANKISDAGAANKKYFLALDGGAPVLGKQKFGGGGIRAGDGRKQRPLNMGLSASMGGGLSAQSSQITTHQVERLSEELQVTAQRLEEAEREKELQKIELSRYALISLQLYLSKII